MKRMLGAALMALLSSGAAQSATDPEAQKILDCMRKNIPQSLRVQTFELTSMDRTGGQRLMRGKLFAQKSNGRLNTMVKIKAPPDLNGAAYLVREGKEKDDMFVFVPALNKVRRITGAGTDGPLFGTDFSYTDIKQMQSAAEGGDVKLEAPAQIEGRDVAVLAITPRAGAPSRYSLIRNWVDQKVCVPLKIEFSEGPIVRKQLTTAAVSITQSPAGHWYLGEARMQDLRENTESTLKVTGLVTDVKLTDRYFNPSGFSLAE